MEEHALRAFLSPKRFHASFELAGHTWEVDVATPDLSACRRSVWGDWGPMYSFELQDVGPLRLSYRYPPLAIESDHEVRVPKIYLESPMQWTRRRRAPFSLEFQDPQRGLAFSGCLDAAGQPVELRVRPLRPEAEIARSLVPQGTWRSGEAPAVAA